MSCRAPASASKSIIDTIYATKQGKIAVECRDLKTAVRLAEALGAAIVIEEDNFQHCLSDLIPFKNGG